MTEKSRMGWSEALAMFAAVVLMVLALVGCGMHVEAMRPPGAMPADAAQVVRTDCYLRAMQAFPQGQYSLFNVDQRLWVANCLRLHGFQ